MSRLRRQVDVLLGIGLVAIFLAEVWVFDAWPGRMAVASADVAALAGLGLGCAFLGSLAWRRRQPLVCLGLGLASIVAADLQRGSVDGAAIPLGVVVTSYSAGSNARGITAWIGLAGVLALIPAVAAQPPGPGGPQPPDLEDLLFLASFLAGPWLVGRAFRFRRERESTLESRALELERTRETRAQAAVLEERQRIARELHDVIAHAISVIVLQARGALRALDAKPEASREALRAIESSASLALAEARRLLGLLRDATDADPLAPLPSLRHLDHLVDRVREAGLPVVLEVDGDVASLPPGLDLAAYRIVQEALTNALKHARQGTARVQIQRRADVLELEITNSGAGAAAVTGGGQGLVGMRERVLLYGGSVEAGPWSEGAFRVHALLPLSAGSP